ncbi:glycosyl hydrolase family 18 protein [Petroclostridium sp. X23]|uniref:glycosyl hydrolase family 18 protein n=1 Tax=Petroclostridium sp. X23 TaxID=3045146 RepID=UPI0024ACA2C1|nr:glycosyl hydrolase family 18 protein [Petroclostridium sp. X23]WHH59953.1 glycosyl hydrolase family 18 protein [Petroclostridium sp. X23]
MKKILGGILLLIILITSGGVAYAFWPNNTSIAPYAPDMIHLIVEDEIVLGKDSVLVENNQVLLALPVIKEYIDSNVHWDEKNSKFIFTTKDKVIRMAAGQLTATVNARLIDLNIPVKLIENIPYAPIEVLKDIFQIEVTWIDSNKVVTIDYKKNVKQDVQVISKKAKVRKEPSIKALILKKDIENNEKMRMFEEYDKWYKVRTEDGVIGYIEKRFVRKVENKIESKEDRNDEVIQSSWKPNNGKINMVWEYVHKSTPNMEKVKKIEGLDVVSPTWFSITDENGTIVDKADAKYVNWAHNNGYKVWALVDNSFDPDITNIILNDSEMREKIIQQLLMYAETYKLDGINIDFENVYLKDKDMVTQFVRELVPMFKEQGLIVSIDVTVKSTNENWSMFYDRKALSEVVDYVALMAYDQHWSSSPKAGSVAQITWVENSLKQVLKEVPADKLLLGLPFYAREWKEEMVNNKKKVTSKALSMKAVKKIISDKNANVSWDDESGQYYAQYKEGQAIYKIWVEDARSITLKASLVSKYGLAGVASWRRGFESEDVWNVLLESLKQKDITIEEGEKTWK